MKLIDVTWREGSLCAWLFDGNNSFIQCSFEPTFFVYAKSPVMRELKSFATKQGASCFWERKKTLWGYRWMLAIRCAAARRDGLARSIKRMAECELFNSDMPVEDLFLFENDVFVGAAVEVFYDAAGRIERLSTQENPTDDYDVPNLRICSLVCEADDVIVDGVRCDFEAFRAAFQESDPDIVIISDEDVRKLQQKGMTFSRFERDSVKGSYGSYFSYGKVLYREPSIHFQGRIHLRSHGTIYGGWGIEYAFEVARICRMTLQHANSHSIGSCMNMAQRYTAFREGFVVAATWSIVERWRSGLDLFYADRGPLIIESPPGRYEDVAEIDFVSLYPWLMIKHNISTETLFCGCCPNNKVPDMHTNLCTKRIGIMPKLLRPIVDRRAVYKSRGGDVREPALKSLLVTCFGYLGFRKSKFARIEAHQAILAYARETLLAAMKLCEERGFEVLHGYTDCLWIRKEPMREANVKELCDAIHREMGLPIKIEGIYDWIKFLPSTASPLIPVPVRFIGKFRTGELKSRGIALRRYDTPHIIKQMQADMLTDLAEGKLPQRRLDEVVARLNAGHVLPEQLQISRTITKETYSKNSPPGVVVAQLRKQGAVPQPGQRITFFIRDQKSAFAQNRYSLSADSYDKVAYVRLAKKAAEMLGVRKERQLTLMEVLRHEKVLAHPKPQAA